MRVLITGATGLIGRHLLERLGEEHSLIGVSRAAPTEPMASRADWVRLDLSGPFDEARLPGRIDAIVHLAQSARYRDFPEGADDLFAVNVSSTHRLLEYARRAGAGSFVLASTGGIYAPSAEPVREDGAITAPGPYFRSKRIAELLVENYRDLIAGALLRLFFVYGAGPSEMLMVRLAEALSRGDEIEIEGDPGMLMNPIHAADVAAAIEAALDLDRLETINVAGPDVVTVTELVEMLATAAGAQARVKHRGANPGDLVADTSMMKSLLDIDSLIPLSRGLESVVSSVLNASGVQEPASE